MMDESRGLERVHLMGIGGSGMSALALLLQGLDCEVSGCDIDDSHYMSQLRMQGIECVQGHSPSHLDRFFPQTLIYSSAVPHDHAELTAARERGIETVGRGEALSRVFNRRRGIGVAGTHGKTTTSSMIAFILERSGLTPSWAIGAEVRDLGKSAHAGGGDLLVAEIDESDGSFEFFSPAITVITNIDWDHVNHFPTRQDVMDAFFRFASGRKPDTPLIVCAEDEGTQLLVERLGTEDRHVVTCGWGKAWEWGAYEVERHPGGGIAFSLARKGVHAGRVNLTVSGEHNVLNALLAIAASVSSGASIDSCASALSSFRGARRRLEKVGNDGIVDVIDDYAHHPAEIEATLHALRGMYPDKRLVVVFQPHRYTRTGVFYRQLASALGMADKVLLLPVYPAGETPEEGKTSEAVFDAMKGKEGRCILLGDIDGALAELEKTLRPGDVLATLGAGNVSAVGPAYLRARRRSDAEEKETSPGKLG